MYDDCMRCVCVVGQADCNWLFVSKIIKQTSIILRRIRSEMETARMSMQTRDESNAPTDTFLATQKIFERACVGLRCFICTFRGTIETYSNRDKNVTPYHMTQSGRWSETLFHYDARSPHLNGLMEACKLIIRALRSV